MHIFPSPAALADALSKGNRKNLLPTAFDPATFQRHAAALDACEARARKHLESPIPVLLFSDFRRFQEDGTRIHYDRGMSARRDRLAQLALCVMGGRDTDGTMLRALEDILWELCNEPCWSLPAHLWPVRPRGAAAAASYPPDPYVRSYRNTIDLCAAELALCMAEILHVLGDRLAPEVVARCHAEIRERVLDSYLLPADAVHWQTIENNWAAVCAGSVATAFLYEEPRPERLLNPLCLALTAMQSFFRSFPADGTCQEGLGYWSYGFGYFVVFAEALREYTGGAIDLLDSPEVRSIASFPLRAAISDKRGVSFSDAGTRWAAPRWLFHRLHERFPDLPLPPCSDGTGSARFAYALRTFLWSTPGPDAPVALPDAVEYLPSAEWLVVRNGGFGFAAKFGANDVPHNHNDIGAFLLVQDDVEGPMDLGSGEYNHAYFGPERYSFLVCGSQGHSVPMIGGATQKAGCEFSARDVRFEKHDDGTVVFSGDISGAYGLPLLQSLRRTFTVRPAESVLDLTDSFAFNCELPTANCEPILERFIGFEKPEILAPGKARFGAFAVEYDASLIAKVTEHPFSAHGAKPAMAYALDLSLPAGTKEFRIRFLG